MWAQVCRRWKQVLTDPRARGELWREVIIDFGHELITAVRRGTPRIPLAVLSGLPLCSCHRPCACLASRKRDSNCCRPALCTCWWALRAASVPHNQGSTDARRKALFHVHSAALCQPCMQGLPAAPATSLLMRGAGQAREEP